MYIYWILLIIFVSIAAISTVSVAMSKKTKRADVSYFYGTRRKIMTLASAYAVIIVVLTAIIYLVYLLTK